MSRGAEENVPTTWRPDSGGRRGLVCFEDDLNADLGPDPDGRRFRMISESMLGGDYYPPDAVQFSGQFRSARRQLEVGDRVNQRAPVFPFWIHGPYFRSMVEIFVARVSDDECEVGYVTTAAHHARGIWQATLTRNAGSLTLWVRSVACPRSIWFWLGLPIARAMQLRARRRAIERFRSMA